MKKTLWEESELLKEIRKSYNISDISYTYNFGHKTITFIIEGSGDTIFLSDNVLNYWLKHGLRHIFSKGKNKLQLGFHIIKK